MADTKTLEYAGFAPRFAAHLIDSVMLGAPLLLFMLKAVIPLVTGLDIANVSESNAIEFAKIFYADTVFLTLGFITIFSSVMAAFAISRWQASPGKRLLGIYLIATDGAKLKFRTALLRAASLPLFVLMLQTPERLETYSKLEQIKATGKTFKDIGEFEQFMSGPTTGLTSLAVMLAIAFWYLLINFTTQKTAFHDILFKSRVVRGKL